MRISPGDTVVVRAWNVSNVVGVLTHLPHCVCDVRVLPYRLYAVRWGDERDMEATSTESGRLKPESGQGGRISNQTEHLVWCSSIRSGRRGGGRGAPTVWCTPDFEKVGVGGGWGRDG
jgi:hypothetical protein